MKILGLSIEGVRLIKAIELKFKEKGLIQIRGKNRQGKTSILDSVEMLFKGTKSVPKNVTTKGEDSSRIIGEFDGYRIERKIKGEKTTIKVTSEDGKEVKSPQKFLDTLVNGLTFDPRPFIEKTAEQKMRFLMDELKIDFAEIDAKIKESEEERTAVGRLVKQYGELPILQKVEEVDVTMLMSTKEKLDKDNATIQRGIDKRESLSSGLADIDTEIEKIVAELEAKKARQQEMTEELAKVNTALDKLGDIADTSELTKAISTASETNKAALAYVTNEVRKKEKRAKQKQYDGYTIKIDDLRAEKKEILRNAPVPIKGLEIRFDGLYYNDIYSENWSDSESMRISCELCAAMQPELRAIFMDKGEAYDNEQLKALNDWAVENDIQALVTIVDSMDGSRKEDAIYIEAGEVI
jgi:hypothetical protein